MLKYLAKRIGRSILTLFVIVTLVFCLLRLMPGIPTDPISLLAGAREAPFRRYFVASLLGAAPKAVTMTLMGSSAHDPLSPRFWVPLLCLAAICAGATVVKKKLTRGKEGVGHDASEKAG